MSPAYAERSLGWNSLLADYAVQVQPGMEETVKAYLGRLEIPSVIPFIKEWRTAKRGRKSGWYQVRMFPGYMFASFDEFHMWESINNTPGVVSLLPVNSERPRPLPLGFVDELNYLMHSGALDVDASQNVVARYLPGELVKIEAGSWAGHSGKMLYYKKGSLILELMLFGHGMPVPIPEHQVASRMQ